MLHLTHKLRLLSPPREVTFHVPKASLCCLVLVPSRPSDFTATCLAAHPTPAVLPLGGEPTGRRSGDGGSHVASSGRLCGMPSHQALACGSSFWAWLRKWTPGFLWAGSLVLSHKLAWGLLNRSWSGPSSETNLPWESYQVHPAPDDTAPRFIGTHKPLHHDMVMIPGEGRFQCL